MRTCLAIIPARAGSKGIPRKNIKLMAGLPLIAWTIREAKKSKLIDCLVVSTEDKKIAAIARTSGAETIVRPAHLSQDTSCSESGWKHAIDVISNRNGSIPGAVVALQATSPLREASDIDRAVDTFEKEKADSLFSACLLDDICLWKKNLPDFRRQRTIRSAGAGFSGRPPGRAGCWRFGSRRV